MPRKQGGPKRRKKGCEVCSTGGLKYTCAQCMVKYCSVSCFKRHKDRDTCQGTRLVKREEHTSVESQDVHDEPDNCNLPERLKSEDQPPLEDPLVLRPLTSLKWPYIPEQSAFPDPLKRDDPKPLQIHHYEAIATSPEIRRILCEKPGLRTLLTRLNRKRGREREDAFCHALAVGPGDVRDFDFVTSTAYSDSGSQGQGQEELSEETLGLRELAVAVETCVRGGVDGDGPGGITKTEIQLGLDWGE